MTSAAWSERPSPSPGVRPAAVSSGRRLAPVVYDLLKERLLDGEYQAGERLSVESLKAEFGVSKQPVMDALRRLATAGLVEIIPQVGSRVPVYGSADVSDFFTIFGGMEGAVAGVAAQRCTDQQIDKLAAVNDEINELVANPTPRLAPTATGCSTAASTASSTRWPTHPWWPSSATACGTCPTC